MRPSTSLGAGEAFDCRLDLAREDRAVEFQRMRSYGSSIQGQLLCTRNAVSEGVRCRLGYQHTSDAINDRLERASSPEGNDRRAASLRFDGRNTEVFFARQQDRGRPPIEIAHGVVGYRSEQLNVGTRARNECRQCLPRSEEHTSELQSPC